MLLSCGIGEDSWESLGLKEIKPVHPKRNQSWIFIGRTDGEAEAPILWPPDAKNCLLGKDPYAVKDWRQEEKEMTEDEMAGWHHGLDAHESEWTLGDGDGQGGLACCDSWNCKESYTTERLSGTELNWFYSYHTTQFRLTTFQALYGHMWLEVTVLNGTCLIQTTVKDFWLTVLFEKGR